MKDNSMPIDYSIHIIGSIIVIAANRPVLVGDYGVVFKTGTNRHKDEKTIFLNDGSTSSKMDSICRGTLKIVATNMINLTPNLIISEKDNQYILDYYNSNKKVPIVRSIYNECIDGNKELAIKFLMKR